MYRLAIEKLKKWKESRYRKPLIIEGARQVGKTWLMKEFGRLYYSNTIYVNFDSNSRMEELFSSDLQTDRILMGLELYFGQKINSEDTLIIFDEVQEVPRALTSLKYFCENSPEYHIICAGSLLGIALHQGTSFPVGKVDFLKLYPLSYREFLMATGNERFADLLESCDFQMITSFKQSFMDALRQYYFVGGMPEAVLRFSENHDFSEVRQIQKRILDAYEQDFSKHAPNETVPKIRMVWNSIPSQLAKENKKFIYGLVREGARAKDYEAAIMWLSDCGLVHKVSRVNAPNIPLKAYEDLKAFKLFLVDVGLLGCMTGLKQSSLLDGNGMFKEFKGALTEQYVMQQFAAIPELNTYYYTNDRGSCEIDFVIDSGGQAVPVEVKAEVNLRAKSLKTYCEKFAPKTAVRTSMADYKKERNLINLPLYAVEEFAKIL
ncbi:MAG: ATP-binding protein [Lachnospiraceae bacterium]|nr:ATP-binding protein [Lachnospiraceae bacterium]